MSVAFGSAAAKRAQRLWAARTGHDVDERGYVAHYQANLLAPISPAAQKAFGRGAGAELVDSGGKAAKMRALHSSSALVVNVFDHWHDRDRRPLLDALGCSSVAAVLEFEAPLRTGAGGIPPHLDVLLRCDDGSTIGIESKFTEWMTTKKRMGDKVKPYFDEHDESYWSRAGLHASHRLAMAVRDGAATFKHLDVPQLLKHALGLAAAARGSSWSLLYLFFDSTGALQRNHHDDLRRFTAVVGDELQFTMLSYQELFGRLFADESAVDPAYASYIRCRYGAAQEGAP